MIRGIVLRDNPEELIIRPDRNSEPAGQDATVIVRPTTALEVGTLYDSLGRPVMHVRQMSIDSSVGRLTEMRVSGFLVEQARAYVDLVMFASGRARSGHTGAD